MIRERRRHLEAYTQLPGLVILVLLALSFFLIVASIWLLRHM